jgi:HlyD family secretion protein
MRSLGLAPATAESCWSRLSEETWYHSKPGEAKAYRDTMKRRIILLLLLIIVGGTLAGTWWWTRTWPGQVIQLLVGVGLDADQAEEFVYWLGGKVEPEEGQPLEISGSIEGVDVAIVSEFGGQIVGLHADEGDTVQDGQVLVELDTSLLYAQMAQAQAAVAAARANLANVEAGTHPGEIMAAEAALQQATVKQTAAETAWQDALAILDNPQSIDLQLVQAQAAVDLAVEQIQQAEAQLATAEVQRDRYRAQGSMEEKWLYAIYNYQVEAAHAAVGAAKAKREGTEQTLAGLRALRDHPLAVVSPVHLAEAQYKISVAGVAVAQATLDELKAGPTPEQVAVAQAKVDQAESAVSALRTQISKMALHSPIAGIVTSCSTHSGEAAVAGAILLTVANLDEVRLTLYVPEDELGRVFLGQEAEVQVDSFPGQVFTGTVAYISPQAEFTPKNVQTEKERINMVFAVRVHLPNPDHLLKPGMPADAVLRDH